MEILIRVKQDYKLANVKTNFQMLAWVSQHFV